MTDKRRLLWHSNAPWSPTGYGNQTAAFTRGIAQHYNLGISAFYGLEGNIQTWHGIPVYPGIGQTHGNETILDHAKVHLAELRNGVVMTLMDVWVLDPSIWRQVNTASWVPVDHDPCPPSITGFFESANAIPIAMSKFGQRQLAHLDALYVPHGVDTSVYKPLDREQSRKDIDLPTDAFIVGMVAANKGNPSRKCFSEAFQAFKAFHDKHPEARLYLHTEAMGRFDGVHLPDLADAVGLDRSLIFFCDQYRAVHYPFPAEKMAKHYSAMDVLLAPSAGEGFGIPVVEAQACGVPVIVSDFSAQPELIGAGWKVSGHKFFTPLRSWQFHPSVESIADKLELAYARSQREVSSDATEARKFAEGYDVEVVLSDYMLPAIAEVFERFEAREPRKLEAAA